MVSPNTGSPGRNRVTFLPTHSTIPAMSVPGIGFFGLTNPDPIRRSTQCRDASTCQTSRQLLTESVIIGLLGGTLGISVAYWGKRLLPGAAGQAPLDWHVLAFTGALSLISGI